MSTRGAIGFRIDNEDKITYNHFDSYPQSLGQKILQELIGQPIDKLKTNARRLVLVGEEPPTKEQIAANKRWANLDVSEHSLEDWYCLLRELQGSLLPYISGALPIMYDGHKFLLDSLFCEYAYVVNLDDDVLEFYRGFNKSSTGAGRYASLLPDMSHRQEHYYGVVLVDTVRLLDLPVSQDTAWIEEIVTRWDTLCSNGE